jgi:Questin oxidase-like
MGSYVDTVTDALERLADLGYERGNNNFANHGPMAAEALAVLGFGAELPAWVSRYRSRTDHHDPPPPRWALDPHDEASWRPAMGAFDRVGDWEQLFRGLLHERPWSEVLVDWWPRLLPGLFTQLTHGLIRTAHAVRSVAAVGEPNDTQLGELARGLAYWAARNQPLPGSAHLTGSRSVAGAVARLPRPGEAGNPGERLRTLESSDDYHKGLDDLADGEPDWVLSEMTATFAGVYLAHPEIAPVPLVHGVTAPAAIRLVLPYLPERLRLPSVAAMWQAHLAMLLAFTTSATDEQQVAEKASGMEVPAAPELMARALDNGDEHVIKLTEAALREHALRPDPRFPAAILAVQERIPRRD